MSHIVGGVILFMLLLVDAVILCIEMFSVLKLKKSFWSAAGGAGYYVAFMHSLS